MLKICERMINPHGCSVLGQFMSFLHAATVMWEWWMPLRFTAFEIIFCRLFYSTDSPVWLDLTGIHCLGKGRCSLLPFPITCALLDDPISNWKYSWWWYLNLSGAPKVNTEGFAKWSGGVNDGQTGFCRNCTVLLWAQKSQDWGMECSWKTEWRQAPAVVFHDLPHLWWLRGILAWKLWWWIGEFFVGKLRGPEQSLTWESNQSKDFLAP